MLGRLPRPEVIEPGAEEAQPSPRRGHRLVEAEWVGDGGHFPVTSDPSFARTRNRSTRVALGATNRALSGALTVWWGGRSIGPVWRFVLPEG
jgi:hypothetical protein